MSLSIKDLKKLEKIANDLDKTGEDDKMKIADSIDNILRSNAALKKISIEIIHPKLLSWLSNNYPKAMHNMESAKEAFKALLRAGSGFIDGVGLQDINNLRNELKKVISGEGTSPSAGVHEIDAA